MLSKTTTEKMFPKTLYYDMLFIIFKAIYILFILCLKLQGLIRYADTVLKMLVVTVSIQIVNVYFLFLLLLFLLFLLL